MVVNFSAPTCAAPLPPHSNDTAADITNSADGMVRNWYFNVVSRFWNPLALGPPGTLRRVQVEPIEMPKLSVMRLENSVETSVSRIAGISPVLVQDTVGSDSSSATQGSSTVSVAGKNRLPTTQCADAASSDASRATSAAPAAQRIRQGMESLRSTDVMASSTAGSAVVHYAAIGGPRGCS